MMREVAFDSAGERCAAWHFSATSDALAGPAGRPCVVMAHGFGGTRDTGLTGYAEGFADAGLDVLLFDYRGFGASTGMPRQKVSWREQRADYRAALASAPVTSPRLALLTNDLSVVANAAASSASR